MDTVYLVLLVTLVSLTIAELVAWVVWIMYTNGSWKPSEWKIMIFFAKGLDRSRSELLRIRNITLQRSCSSLRVENSRLKDDIAQTRQSHDTLQKKFFRAYSAAYQLKIRLSSVSTCLTSEKSKHAKQERLFGLLLGSILVFTRFARISSKRIRLLSRKYCELQSRFSTLFSGHLALRRRYLDLERLCVDSRLAAKRLSECLERVQAAKEILVWEKAELVKTRDSLEDELRSAQELSWTVVSRYDDLQTTHSELLINNNRLKGDCHGFKIDLRQIATQVQETLEVTELGLNDLHKSGDPRLSKFKQDLLKIGHKLDVLRLNITELLAGMTIVCALGGKEGSASPGAPPSYTPGSLEDAVRKLRTLSESAKNDSSDSHAETADDLQDKTLAEIPLEAPQERSEPSSIPKKASRISLESEVSGNWTSPRPINGKHCPKIATKN